MLLEQALSTPAENCEPQTVADSLRQRSNADAASSLRAEVSCDKMITITGHVLRELHIESQKPDMGQGFEYAKTYQLHFENNSNDFAIRESGTSVKVFKNFVEKPGGLDVGFQADGLSGGVLLGVTGQGGIAFFDWATGNLVRRIEVEPRAVSS